ncbi:hypothetical protein NA78x_001528 [Anatilimnocola sp. NA78]|uniref:tetratricopeptide repeat protein n=1 Tax=Anatilimnocola sp. NA78 TaxID=3415683 RepID=UPI003CE4FA59
MNGSRAKSTPQTEVERLIEKGRIKEAFKQAKQCLHQQNTPDNRCLVEKTYLLRIDELARGEMVSAAAEVAKNFLDFGVTDPSSLEQLVLILPRIGMASQALALADRIESPDAKMRLGIKVADEAVLHPVQLANVSPEVRAGAERIRAALAAVERASDSDALDLLKEIPRNSPWADWRYFVRGLIAFYREDQTQTLENWNRLDPQRAAHSIAEVLQRSTNAVAFPAQVGKKNTPDFSQLEIAAFGEPLLTWTEELQRLIDPISHKGPDWQKACRKLSLLRTGLQRYDPRLAQRLTEVLIMPVMEIATQLSFAQAERLLRDFTTAAEPLTFDPQWNRFWALMWEQEQGDAQVAIEHWQKYLADLEQLSTLEPAQRRRMQAVVWRHIAEIHVDSDVPSFTSVAAERGPTPEQLRPAIEALEQSLRLDPQQRATYQMLLELTVGCDLPDATAEFARRFLAAFPAEVTAVRLLIEHYRRLDEADEMLRYVERMREIQPLESTLVSDEFWARISLARQLAIAGKLDEGWAELARCEVLVPESADSYRMFTRRAILKLKAGQDAEAVEFVNLACRKLDEPTAIWLALHIDSIRYRLPRKLQDQFNDSLQSALKNKVTSQTAGQLAELLYAIAFYGIEYAGFTQHSDDVARYLRRTTRIKFAEKDLRTVCCFLKHIQADPDLLEKLVKKGLKSFPQASVYQSLAADLEMAMGPFKCNLQAVRKHLQAALRLAEASIDPTDRSLIPDLKQRLLIVDDMSKPLPGMPPSADFPGGFQGTSMQEMLAEVMRRLQNGETKEDLLNEFARDDNTDFFFGPPPRRQPPAPRKRK